ncbi:MAG: DciA family protein [Alphaproteobacteria bacterium]
MLPSVTASAFGRRGLAMGRLLSDWASIVGAEFAARSLPERFVFPRGARTGGVLRLRVAPGWALMIQHVTPQIIERINGFFGYRAVDRLAVIQGPLPASRAKKPEPAARPLTPADETAIASAVAPVTDPELRQALSRLGAALKGGPAS